MVKSSTAATGWKVSTEHNRSKAFTDQAYLYSHSQQIYLLDKRGRTRGFYFAGSPLGRDGGGRHGAARASDRAADAKCARTSGLSIEDTPALSTLH